MLTNWARKAYLLQRAWFNDHPAKTNKMDYSKSDKKQRLLAFRCNQVNKNVKCILSAVINNTSCAWTGIVIFQPNKIKFICQGQADVLVIKISDVNSISTNRGMYSCIEIFMKNNFCYTLSAPAQPR
jgi:hypothetical protein